MSTLRRVVVTLGIGVGCNGNDDPGDVADPEGVEEPEWDPVSYAVWDLGDGELPTELEAVWVGRIVSEGASVIPGAVTVGLDGVVETSTTDSDGGYVASATVVAVSYPDACASLTAMVDAFIAAGEAVANGDRASAAAILEGADTTSDPDDFWQVSLGFATGDAAGQNWTMDTFGGPNVGQGDVYHHRRDVDWAHVMNGGGIPAEVATEWYMDDASFAVTRFDPVAWTFTGSAPLRSSDLPNEGSVELTINATRCVTLEASLAALGVY